MKKAHPHTLSQIIKIAILVALAWAAPSHAQTDQENLDALIREILGTEYGDANLDGMVDSTDLSILAQQFDASGTWEWEHGDFNGDEAVNLDDLTILGTFFGFGVPEADLVTFSSAIQQVSLFANVPVDHVPEPASIAGLSLLCLASLRRPRRR